VAVVAALALGGCSSGGGSETKQTPSADGQSATVAGTAGAVATSGPTPSGSGTGSSDPTQTVDGVWLTTQGGTKVQLVLGKGKAGLTSTSLCGGGYTDRDGIGLYLTCMDGNKERTSGHGVLAADGKTLTVTWSGGLTDTFSRTGLPSS
jgi:hypothetical protein